MDVIVDTCHTWILNEIRVTVLEKPISQLSNCHSWSLNFKNNLVLIELYTLVI